MYVHPNSYSCVVLPLAIVLVPGVQCESDLLVSIVFSGMILDKGHCVPEVAACTSYSFATKHFLLLVPIARAGSQHTKQ